MCWCWVSWKRWQNKSPSVLVANLSWGNLDVRSFRQESQVEGREGEATIRLQCRQRSSSSVCGTFLDRLPKLHRGRCDSAGGFLVKCCNWFVVGLGGWGWGGGGVGEFREALFVFLFLTCWLTHFEIRNSAGTGLWQREGRLHCAISSQVWGCQFKFPPEPEVV